MKTKLTIGIFLAYWVSVSAVHANPPHLPDLVRNGNYWTITFYDDSSASHNQWATQGICFYYAGAVGTHQRYYWVSNTFPDWNGRATQEGDNIFMHGDYRGPSSTQNGGHDGIEWEITTVNDRNEGFGHWMEWVENAGTGFTIGFGNAKFRRVGRCAKRPFLNYASALEAGKSIRQKSDRSGKPQSNPMGLPDAELKERMQSDEIPKVEKS